MTPPIKKLVASSSSSSPGKAARSSRLAPGTGSGNEDDGDDDVDFDEDDGDGGGGGGGGDDGDDGSAGSTPAPESNVISTVTVVDKFGERFAFYKDVPGILSALKARPDVQVAAASRTQTPKLAREMLKLLRVPLPPPQEASKDKKNKKKPEKGVKALETFDLLEMYPGELILLSSTLSNQQIIFQQISFFGRETYHLQQLFNLDLIQSLVLSIRSSLLSYFLCLPLAPLPISFTIFSEIVSLTISPLASRLQEVTFLAPAFAVRRGLQRHALL